MAKLSKVLIIGSGPIIIGQADCHSEEVRQGGRLKNPSWFYHLDGLFATLRETEGVQGDRERHRVTERGMRLGR